MKKRRVFCSSLMMINDDLTEGYDSIVKPYSGKCVILNIDNHHNPYDLFIMRKVY